MKCENCNNEHDSKYGSGRFCCEKCARGFSTKYKRKEINIKVGIKLKNRIYKKINNNINFKKYKIKKQEIKRCICGEIFVSNSKTCSKKCGHILAGINQKGSIKKSGINRKKGSGGYRENGGKSIQYEYINHLGYKMKLNKEEIRVAKVLDNLKLNWERNTKGFSYIDLNNNNRKYYPDFYIIDQNIYIEYKGWITEEMIHKMNDAQIKNDDLNLIIIYGNDKRYKDLGFNIEEFEMHPHVPRLATETPNFGAVRSIRTGCAN